MMPGCGQRAEDLGRSLFRRAGLNGCQPGVIGEVGVPLRGRIAGVTQHLADSEQIDAAVDTPELTSIPVRYTAMLAERRRSHR